MKDLERIESLLRNLLYGEFPKITKVKVLKEDNDILQEKVATYKDTVQRQAENISQLSNEIKRIHEFYKEKAKKSHANSQEWIDKYGSLFQESSEILEKMQNLEKTCKRQEKIIEDFTVESLRLMAEVQSLENKNDLFSKDISEQSTTIDNLKSALEEWKHCATRSKEDLNTLRKTCEDLLEIVGKKEEKIIALENTELQAKNDYVTKEKKYKKDIEKLKHIVRSQGASAAELSKTFGCLKEQVERLYEKNNSLKESLCLKEKEGEYVAEHIRNLGNQVFLLKSLIYLTTSVELENVEKITINEKFELMMNSLPLEFTKSLSGIEMETRTEQLAAYHVNYKEGLSPLDKKEKDELYGDTLSNPKNWVRAMILFITLFWVCTMMLPK